MAINPSPPPAPIPVGPRIGGAIGSGIPVRSEPESHTGMESNHRLRFWRPPTIGPPAYMVRVPHGQRTTVPCVRLPSRPIATPLDGHNNAARQAGHTGPHPKPSTGVPVGCLAGEAGFEPATHGSKDRRAANCTTRLYHAAYAAAMVTVCAPNHPLGTLRRCRRRRTLPACTPPCSAWSATTRWYHGPLCLPIGRRAGGVSFRAFGGIRTRGLPLRRRTPYPLGHESVVSSAVPTAVHVPDTHRAWNRTTIGIATITRSPPPHPIPGGAAPPTTPLSYQYSRPAACATGSQRFPALDSCPRQDSNLRPDG